MSEMQLQQAQITGMGGLPDYPDDRDKTHYIEVLTELPPSVDLREWCSKIEDQGKLNSCTAHAAIALLEYFENRAFGKHVVKSPINLVRLPHLLLQYKHQQSHE